MAAHEFDLIVNEVGHIPICFGFASIENETFYSVFNSFFVVGKLWEFNVAESLVVTGSHYGDTCAIDFVINVDCHAVDNIVRTAIDDNAFYVRQSLEFVDGDVVWIDFAVDTKRSDGASQNGVFVTTQV